MEDLGEPVVGLDLRPQGKQWVGELQGVNEGWKRWGEWGKSALNGGAHNHNLKFEYPGCSSCTPRRSPAYCMGYS